jgi:hypothetical protein
MKKGTFIGTAMQAHSRLHREIWKAAQQARLDYDEVRDAFYTLRNGSGRHEQTGKLLHEAVTLLLAMPER